MSLPKPIAALLKGVTPLPFIAKRKQSKRNVRKGVDYLHFKKTVAMPYFVYVLCSGDTVVRVGSTHSLRIRTLAHVRNLLFDRVVYLEVTGFPAKQGVERFLIKTLRPTECHDVWKTLPVDKTELQWASRFLIESAFREYDFKSLPRILPELKKPANEILVFTLAEYAAKASV